MDPRNKKLAWTRYNFVMFKIPFYNYFHNNIFSLLGIKNRD